MSSRNGRTPRHKRGERSRLRAAVLHLGIQLGWQPDEVIAFSGALTGGCWQSTPPTDLLHALPEYLILLQPPQSTAGAEAALTGANERSRCRAWNRGGDHAARN